MLDPFDSSIRSTHREKQEWLWNINTAKSTTTDTRSLFIILKTKGTRPQPECVCSSMYNDATIQVQPPASINMDGEIDTS